MQYNGYKIEIEHDDAPVNPRKEYDQIGEIVTWGKLQHLSDNPDIPAKYTGTEYKRLLEENGSFHLPVYCYQHSCIMLSTAPFSCPWDSGQIGFIFMSKKTFEEEYSGNITTATRVLVGEVEEFSNYLNGDIYGYIIKDENGDIIDSCWGINGYDYCMSEAKMVVDTIVSKQTV